MRLRTAAFPMKAIHSPILSNAILLRLRAAVEPLSCVKLPVCCGILPDLYFKYYKLLLARRRIVHAVELQTRPSPNVIDEETYA